MVSRWYRPPEIILISEKHEQGVDIWSLGCIFADFLALSGNHEVDENYRLFPGTSCHPLSPMK
tara:strand:+ start:707 stop:895 length:189 start_codon:yes stop_codon:yes gene_type:complete